MREPSVLLPSTPPRQQRLPDRSVPAAAPRDIAAPMVGICVEARQALRPGRHLIRWKDPAGEPCQKWLPKLTGTVVREADRVLILRAANWDEPVIIGVLDGFARRPAAPEVSGPSILLQKDEVISLTTAEGRPILEVRQGASGPAVRIVDEDVHLEVPGRLRIDARQIELQAKQGGVDIRAEDDVRLEGEVIHLNGPR